MSPVEQIGPVPYRRELLQIARDAANEFFGARPAKQHGAVHIEGRFGGLFTTLWSGKTLRGCRGLLTPLDDVVEAVRETTRLSLTDPRFTAMPVTPEELKEINIEISVLSELVRAGDPLDLVPGVHGILIRRGVSSGCFLPKVATENRWSAEEFLTNCCTMKAGLPPESWREAATEVQLFTADVFAESDFA